MPILKRYHHYVLGYSHFGRFLIPIIVRFYTCYFLFGFFSKWNFRFTLLILHFSSKYNFFLVGLFLVLIPWTFSFFYVLFNDSIKLRNLKFQPLILWQQLLDDIAGFSKSGFVVWWYNVHTYCNIVSLFHVDDLTHTHTPIEYNSLNGA